MPKTKKSLGQHWLFDQPILHTIIDVAKLKSEDTVLEIGPGRGPLTELLANQCKKVVAIEKDSELVPGLRAQFALRNNVEIIEEDILKFNLDSLPSKYVVVANIPYYLTSTLLRNLLTSNNPPKNIILLIQKEVAESIVALPGRMSTLAISIQLLAKPQLVTIVAKDKFHPPPKVDSAIIRITPLGNPVIDVNPDVFMRLVKAGFSQKRKTLRNSLAGSLHIKGSVAEKLLIDAKISPSTRAQELSFVQWKDLYDTALSIL